MEPDDTMIEITRAIAVSQQGLRDEGRRLLTDLWVQVEASGDALHCVAVAHALADVQDDPRDELAWDTRALEHFSTVTDARLARAGVPAPTAALLPSLHLNLGEVHRKLGDLPAARHHLVLGRAAAGTLGQDGYSRMITRGLDGLAERLAAG